MPSEQEKAITSQAMNANNRLIPIVDYSRNSFGDVNYEDKKLYEGKIGTDGASALDGYRFDKDLARKSAADILTDNYKDPVRALILDSMYH